MARKNLLSGLTADELAAANSGTAAAPPAAPQVPPDFVARGAPGTIVRGIHQLADGARAAKDLEARLTAGQVIVELDPALIDPSFIADRMPEEDATYAAVRSAIAAEGQTSPILVRPHPAAKGRYQVAFGHRRLRVAKDLGRSVRAVVKNLTDQELIIAQGQENSARADLSFIERALFAARLADGGYDRDVIMSALSVDTTEVSKLLFPTKHVPPGIIAAIGPARATGRPRWLELASHFKDYGPPAGLPALVESAAFRAADSDSRFGQVADLALASARTSGTHPRSSPRRDVQAWAPQGGEPVVAVTRNARTCLMSFDLRRAPGFGDFVLTEMDRLYAMYMAQPNAGGEAAAPLTTTHRRARTPGR